MREPTNYEMIFRGVKKEHRDIYVTAARLYESLGIPVFPRDIRAMPWEQLTSDIALMTSAIIHANESSARENEDLTQLKAYLEHQVHKLTVDLGQERLDFHRLTQTMRKYKASRKPIQ